MAANRRSEDRLLDADEKKLVAGTRHPELADMKADDLRKLARTLRERRDKASRAVRKGNRAAKGSDKAGDAERGNREKAGLIQSAIARVNKEFSRRGEARE
ncbi:hypothetical protein [Devosia chinhatensis]|uniref:hypothetical protein n=1 Tax=Devosia chinhatensis TaxID=429727 RepID=UPI000697D37B|nr:hypothetical protein [Devosia chinhatensis]